MNAVIEEPNKNVTELRAPGPGERLRSARLSAGLEISMIAAQLHLDSAMVHALERDDYQAMPGRVFVRGYLRNYARLVNVPVDSVMKQFDELMPDQIAERQLNRIGSGVRREVGSGHGLVRFITWTIVVAVVGTFFIWWQGYLSWLGQSSEQLISAEQEPTGPSLVSAVVERDGTLALPIPSGSGINSDRSSGTDEPVLNMHNDTALALPAQTQDPVPAGSNLGGEPVAALPTSAVAGQREDVVSPTDVVPNTSQQIVMQFDGPCWVDVRDATRDFKLYGEMPTGARKVLGGTPPYNMVIGNATVVTLLVDGTPYDLSKHARGNVARFKFDPAAI